MSVDAVSAVSGSNRTDQLWEMYAAWQETAQTQKRERDASPTGAFPPVPSDNPTDPSDKSGKVRTGECQTCKNRKYQDGSDDPGVSFKTPTRVSPEAAATAVRSHESEHVTRERAKANREDREVVSQSVVYRTAICPECGRSYVSGGTTTTATRNAEKTDDTPQETEQARPDGQRLNVLA